MRILVISNLYPPYFVGGYELGCRDVVDGLKARGHHVKVLTSTYGVNKPEHDSEVYRWLQSDLGWNTRSLTRFVKLLRKEVRNQIAFKRICTTFSPDAVYIWNLTHISISLAFLAQNMKLPVYYFVFDNWLSRWEIDSWYSLWNRQSTVNIKRYVNRLFRHLLNVAGFWTHSNPLDLNLVQFASHYLKQFALQAGKPVADAKVIHWGVDAPRYSCKKASHKPDRLLYVGQLAHHKGVHIAVEALKILVAQHGYKSASLTLVGGTIVPDYEKYIRRLVSSLNLQNHVQFVGFVRHDDLPSIYQDHDILVFPSLWDEPFGITLLEGMSAGLAIVGTGTGGSGEILKNEVNALVFPKNDAKACATQIRRLMDDSALIERIRQNGRRMVEEKFGFDGMMDRIENSLFEVAV